MRLRYDFVLGSDTSWGFSPILCFSQSVAFHKKYPLFATASDDATVHVLYGKVHADLNENALIVPLKILRAHTPHDCEGVLDCAFHPTQPWLFSAGADGSIVLFCDEI